MDAIEPPRAPNIPPEIVPIRARQFRIPKSFSAIRHRNFRLYMGGQLVSLVGTWMQIVAQGWLVYQLSHSELALGLVGFASAIPALIISPWAGVIVDRVPKRKILVATQVGAMLLAFILSAMNFAGIVQVWHVIILAAGLGVVNAFDGPARQAFVVEMVGREDLPNAIAMNSMTFNSARILGPGIGGLLLVAFGSSWCFLLNGLSFLAVIASLLAMQLTRYEHKPLTLSPWKQLTSGLAYAKNTPELRGLLLMALFFSLFGISYSTVLPAFIDKVLHQGAGAFGVINAMTGVGAVAGAFVIAQYGDSGHRGNWLVWSSLLFPLVLAAFAINHNYPAAMVLALLLGLGFMLTFTLINTLLQTRLADEMRGRVLSLYTLTFYGFTPFGNLLIGSLSERLGLSTAITASAVASLALSAFVILSTKELRRLA
ncbi:MAG: MFS transporter [Chloroflexi bacterium]|nr:MFS transporter [Chloroflexota bacterium]